MKKEFKAKKLSGSIKMVEGKTMMSLSSQKRDNFIAHADSRKECLKIKDGKISEECEAFAKEIENEMTQLCPIIHEDL
jgi:hypothetical protein